MTITTQPPVRTKARSRTKSDGKAKAPAEHHAGRPSPAPSAEPGHDLSAGSMPPAEPRTTALSPDEWPDMSHIVTEDDTPVDNIFSEKQQRLLTEPLYSSWAGPGKGRSFLALANVGLFFGINEPPLVPDAMLSLDVRPPDDLWPKPNRSYFVWMYGKPPEVVIEVVSNRKGGEDDRKRTTYARIGIAYYAIFDPEEWLSARVLRVYRLHSGVYRLAPDGDLPHVRLSLRLWEGEFEGSGATWLRWHDLDGNVIPTGAERADTAQARAEAEHELAEAEHERAEAERAQAGAERARADAERARAERLAEQLRALGVEVEG